jgi:hypothetical protein
MLYSILSKVAWLFASRRLQWVSLISVNLMLTILNTEYWSLGFGLGLELTTRLIEQYDWDYQHIDTNYGRKVSIDFNR